MFADAVDTDGCKIQSLRFKRESSTSNRYIARDPFGLMYARIDGSGPPRDTDALPSEGTLFWRLANSNNKALCEFADPDLYFQHAFVTNSGVLIVHTGAVGSGRIWWGRASDCPKNEAQSFEFAPGGEIEVRDGTLTTQAACGDCDSSAVCWCHPAFVLRMDAICHSLSIDESASVALTKAKLRIALPMKPTRVRDAGTPNARIVTD